MKIIITAVMWSVGAILELSDRKKVSCLPLTSDYNLHSFIHCVQLEEKFFELGGPAGFPMPNLQNPDDTIFEYMVDEKGQWQHWEGRVSREHRRIRLW